MLLSFCCRWFALTSTFAVVALAAALVTASPAHSATTVYQYGAFAYSPAHHSIVAAGSGPDAADADSSAVTHCDQRAAGCVPVTWFRHAYASFAVGAGTGSKKAWGWGRAGTAAGADQNALSYCKNHGGGMQCHIVLRAVTASPSASAQQGSDLIGRVCMINAPTGAFTLGHVGWAYLVNRDTGQWEFGANAGPQVRCSGRSEQSVACANRLVRNGKAIHSRLAGFGFLS